MSCETACAVAFAGGDVTVSPPGVAGHTFDPVQRAVEKRSEPREVAERLRGAGPRTINMVNLLGDGLASLRFPLIAL